jgi:Dolichyl-phosphate-mannose-protein mannosyltransferase
MASVERLTAAVLLAGALLIRLLYIRQPIRHDEAYTYLYFAAQPLGSALSDYSVPNNHLFHTLLVKAVTSVLGGSLPAIRLSAFVAGLLIVPAVYLVTRRLGGDRGASMLAMAPAAVWPELVHYSTNARGYSIVALAFLALIMLGDEMVERDTARLAVAIAVVLAIGMWTAPFMLYPGGAALLWIVVERGRRAGLDGVRALLPRLAATVLLAGVLTVVAYSPVVLRSGLAPLVGNKYVVARTLGGFVAELPSFAGDVRNSLGLGVSIPLLGLLALAAVFGALSPRDGRGRRLALGVTVLGWTALLLVVTRRAPPARVLLFLVPLGCAYAGMGLAVVVRRLASGGRIEVPSACAIVALLLAGTIGAMAIRSRAVLRTVETGTLADAPAIARYLLERLRIGDRIVVRNPSDHVLDYYLWRSGGRRLSEINARTATGRVFVVVEPRHLQTLETVQSIEPRLPWAELAASIPADTFASARVYTFRSTAANPAVLPKQPGQKQ